jgi:hypothetical protein
VGLRGADRHRSRAALPPARPELGHGSEFINDDLIRYCTAHEIAFTRARPYRKNDNCFVQQKNWSVARQAVGYLRYDTQAELEVLGELYGRLRL